MAVETTDDAAALVSLARLNHEPVVVLGLNRSEVMILIIAACGFWLPICQLLAVINGRWQSGIPLGAGLALATVVIAGVVLAKVKRNRPDGYYQLAIRLRLEDFGLLDTGLIRREGEWDIRHHEPPKHGLNRWRSKTR